MSGGSQYGNQVAYQNIIPTAVPLQIINQANAVQPGQQFILIDQANGRQQIVQMPSEMTGQVQQAPVSQTRIIQQPSEQQQQQHQPAKKVRRIEHQDNTSMRGSWSLRSHYSIYLYSAQIVKHKRKHQIESHLH